MPRFRKNLALSTMNWFEPPKPCCRITAGQGGGKSVGSGSTRTTSISSSCAGAPPSRISSSKRLVSGSRTSFDV